MNYATRFAPTLLSAFLVLTVQTAQAQPTSVNPKQNPRPILFKNVKVFDGKSENLTAMTSVLVVGNKIENIGDSLQAPEGATIINGEGRTLMPGLIDNHWHSMFATIPQAKLLTADIGYINVVAARDSRATLLRGFTSVRDVGGPVFGLKQAIDEGVVARGLQLQRWCAPPTIRFNINSRRLDKPPLCNPRRNLRRSDTPAANWICLAQRAQAGVTGAFLSIRINGELVRIAVVS